MGIDLSSEDEGFLSLSSTYFKIFCVMSQCYMGSYKLSSSRHLTIRSHKSVSYKLKMKMYFDLLLLLLSLDPHLDTLLWSMCYSTLTGMLLNSCSLNFQRDAAHTEGERLQFREPGLHMHYYKFITRTRILDTHWRLVTFVVTDKKAKLFPLINHIKYSFYATLLLTSITRTKPEKELICATKVRKTADYGKFYLSQIHNH